MFPYDGFSMSIVDFKHTPRIFYFRDVIFFAPFNQHMRVTCGGISLKKYHHPCSCARADTSLLLTAPPPRPSGIAPSQEWRLQEGQFYFIPVPAWHSTHTGIRVSNIFFSHILVEHSNEVPLA